MQSLPSGRHLSGAVKISELFGVRSRNALVMTETELKLMAAAAIMGLSSNPNTG